VRRIAKHSSVPRNWRLSFSSQCWPILHT